MWHFHRVLYTTEKALTSQQAPASPAICAMQGAREQITNKRVGFPMMIS